MTEGKNRFIAKYGFDLKKKGRLYVVNVVNTNRYHCRKVLIFGKLNSIINSAYHVSQRTRLIKSGDICAGIDYSSYGNKEKLEFNGFQNSNDIYDTCLSIMFEFEFVFLTFPYIQRRNRPNLTITESKFKKVEGEWDYDNPCYYCGHVFLKSQLKHFRKKCCREGTVMKDPSLSLPPLLASFCAVSDANRTFLKNQCLINNIIAYGSIGVDHKYNSGYINTNGGSVCLRGRTYASYRTAGNSSSLLYFLSSADEESELQKILHSNGEGNNEELLTILKDLMHEQSMINEISKEVSTIYDRFIRNEEEIIVANVEFKVPMSVFDVSIYKSNDDRPPAVAFKLKNNLGGGHQISANHDRYEAMLYPLFYPYGEIGHGSSTSWRLRNEERLSLKRTPFHGLNFSDYASHLILQPEQNMYYVNAINGYTVPCNRFNIISKLSQFWLVDMLSRMIDKSLSYAEIVNKTFFNEELSGYANSRKITQNIEKRDSNQYNNHYDVEILNEEEGGMDDYDALDDDDNDDNENNHIGNYEFNDINDGLVDNNHNDDNDDDDNDDNDDKKFVLSSSVTGSIRHLVKCARNALHVVSVLGKPTCFITLTANPEWIEIKQMLAEGQSAFERPDVVMQVFHERLDALLHNLRNGKYFEENNLVKFEVRVIEYQHRGLPHAHLVVGLTNMPDNMDDMKLWINKHISTEGTIFHGNEYELKALVKKFMVHKCVAQNDKNPTGCLNSKGYCRKRFHLMKACDTCSFDDKGFPIYQRRESDLNIVSYNKKILLDWQGHANVCFTENTYTINYLYGYIFKGNKKVKSHIKVGNLNRGNNEVELRNEYSLYLKCRKICSMDAMNRIFGYETYPSSNPRVKVINAQLPETVNLILSKGIVSDLYIYFMRPPELKNLTYQAFHQWYRYEKGNSNEVLNCRRNKKSVTTQIQKGGITFKLTTNSTTQKKKVVRNGNHVISLIDEVDEDNEDNEIMNPASIITSTTDTEELLCSLPNVTYTKVFRLENKDTVYKLIKKQGRSLIRIEGMSLRAGELSYIQMLLADNPDEMNDQGISNRCPTSFKDLKTYDGTLFQSFQEVAIACGIVKNPKYVTAQFKVICRHVTSCAMRRKQFFLWTKEDYPTLHIFNNGIYDDDKGAIYKMLVQDWIDQKRGLPFAKNEIRNQFLEELQTYLSEDSCRENILQFYGFPCVPSTKTEIDLEKMRYDKESQILLVHQLEQTYPYNEEQNLFINDFKQEFNRLIRNNSNSDDAICLFLNGAGGTGKTTLLNIVAAYVRSHGEICKIAAATGLAATNYKDASTFHSLCKIPIVEGEERDIETYQKLKLKLTKQRLELLLATRVIILDELPFNHRECIESLFDCADLNGLKGKIIIGAGDFKQLLPVLENSSSDEIIGISLSSSPIWNKFKARTYTLKKNMRLSTIPNILDRNNQIVYAKILENVGNGECNCDNIKVTKDETCITNDENIYSLYDMKHFVTNNELTEQTKNEDDATINESLKWLYNIEELDNFEPSMAVNSVILANTNIKVDAYNRAVQLLNKKEEKTYKSFDSLADVQDNKKILASMLTEEQLNKKNNPSAPPHALTLRLNDICILTRNISIKDGLVNNARVRILQFFNSTILIETVGERKLQFMIPRIKFKFSYSYGMNFAILRQQFPLKLCYAFTVHKVQGQTMGKVLFDVTEPVFCHGALYVAMSRIRKYSCIAFILKRKDTEYDENTKKQFIKTKNIVYKRVLRNAFIM